MLPIHDGMIPSGPPPQAILSQRWMWHILLTLLAASFMLRFLGLDVPGALLSGLMLCFAVVMTRDGMQEISRYALVFTVLCSLNFFFDILPLLTELGGRVQSQTMPVTAKSGNGMHQTVYTVTVKTTPFFDSRGGFVYNVQSLGMVVSPMAMALGVYLALSAHSELQRTLTGVFDEEWQEAGFAARPMQPPRAAAQPAAQEERLTSDRTQGRGSFEHFQGRAYKLPSSNEP